MAITGTRKKEVVRKIIKGNIHFHESSNSKKQQLLKINLINKFPNLPVCLACQDFLLLHTAFKNGNKDGMPKAEATTANALAVVLRTYSSILSISGLMVDIIVARPAAFAKLEMISRPSTRA